MANFTTKFEQRAIEARKRLRAKRLKTIHKIVPGKPARLERLKTPTSINAIKG